MATVASSLPPLPDRLMRFFARYPPSKFSSYATGQRIPTLKQRVDVDAKPLSSSNVPVQETSLDSAETIVPAGAEEATSTTSTTQPPLKTLHNPFLPRKDHRTGKWSGARYGLRIQADLFKLARQHGVEELLPPSIKSSDFKQRRVLERGLQVKGTGEGQRVKGHKWERQITTTLEKRRKAMEEMPEMIRLWKERGHGRGWKKYPK